MIKISNIGTHFDRPLYLLNTYLFSLLSLLLEQAGKCLFDTAKGPKHLLIETERKKRSGTEICYL